MLWYMANCCRETSPPARPHQMIRHFSKQRFLLWSDTFPLRMFVPSDVQVLSEFCLEFRDGCEHLLIPLLPAKVSWAANWSDTPSMVLNSCFGIVLLPARPESGRDMILRRLLFWILCLFSSEREKYFSAIRAVWSSSRVSAPTFTAHYKARVDTRQRVRPKGKMYLLGFAALLSVSAILSSVLAFFETLVLILILS